MSSVATFMALDRSRSMSAESKRGMAPRKAREMRSAKPGVYTSLPVEL